MTKRIFNLIIALIVTSFHAFENKKRTLPERNVLNLCLAIGIAKLYFRKNVI